MLPLPLIPAIEAIFIIKPEFDFFNKLLIFHSNSSVNNKKMSVLLGINPYFLSEYDIASKNYNLKSVVKIISLIRDYDMFSKGVGVKKVNADLLMEMVSRIINIG